MELPKVRGPFLNSPATRLGLADGEELYWLSTWNAVEGALGVCFSRRGVEKVHRFGPVDPGFYSRAFDGQRLWLWGNLSRPLILDLESGVADEISAPAPNALVFHGMALSREQGLALAIAFDGTDTWVSTISREGHAGQGLRSLGRPQRYLKGSTRVEPDRFLLAVEVPGTAVLEWRPSTDELLDADPSDPWVVAMSRPSLRTLLSEKSGSLTMRDLDDLLRLDQGIADHPGISCVAAMDDHAMVWLEERDRATTVYRASRAGVLDPRRWCVLPDTPSDNVVVTPQGEILSLSLYGELRLTDSSGRCVTADAVDAESAALPEILVPAGDRWIVGSTFITQHMWVADRDSGAARTLGRVAPGYGQVTAAVESQGDVYFGSYNSGHILRLSLDGGDPCVVHLASPPTALRPTVMLEWGDTIVCASSRKYGLLGSVITLIDHGKDTPSVRYLDDPMDGLAVTSIMRVEKGAVVGTSVDGDSRSTPSRHKAAEVLLLADPDNWSGRLLCRLPEHRSVRVQGLLEGAIVLTARTGDGRDDYLLLDPSSGDIQRLPHARGLAIAHHGTPHVAMIPPTEPVHPQTGLMVRVRGAVIFLIEPRSGRTLWEYEADEEVHRVAITDTDLLAAGARRLLIFESIFSRLPIPLTRKC